jgi:hypothetical protein
VSYHNILKKNLNLHPITAKFIPQLLTNNQKEQYVAISQELFHQAHFIKIVKGDKTWVYGCDIETKRKSSKRISEFSPDTPSLLKC